MQMKTLGIALALMLSPAIAAAQCAWDREVTASACAEGQVFDAATAACLPATTS